MLAILPMTIIMANYDLPFNSTLVQGNVYNFIFAEILGKTPYWHF